MAVASVVAAGLVGSAALEPRPHWLDAAAHTVPVLATTVVLAGALLRLVHRARPARFAVRDGGFTVPATGAVGLFAACGVLLFGGLGALMFDLWTRRYDEAPAGTALTVALTMTLLCLSVLGAAVPIFVAALRGRPRIELTPAAIEVWAVVGRLTAPWEALRAGATPLADRHRVRLALARPELVTRRGLQGRVTIDVFNSRVDPAFLAAAIRYYTDRPDLRDTIGTVAGYERLLADLGAPLPVSSAQDA